MDMRASGRPGNRSSESDERYASFAQVLGERFAFDAVRMKSNIHGITMIEAQSIMSGGLSQRGQRQAAAKRLGKVSFYSRRFLQGPFKAAIEARQIAGLAISVYRQRRQAVNLLTQCGFRDRDICF